MGGGAPKQNDALHRGLRFGPASAVYAIVVIAVLVIINVLGVRYQANADLTSNHQFTLSSATLKILSQIHQPVQILAFMQPGSQLQGQVDQLLQEYKVASHGEISYQDIDPAAHPTEAQQNSVIEYNTVVVKSGKGHASATPADFYSYDSSGNQVFTGEAAITDAIMRAANPNPLKVYFLDGEGEQSLGNSYSEIGQYMAAQGYTTASINLLTTTAVPTDASAVVIAGPQHDLAPSEVSQLQAYVKAGGHIMVLLDPTPSGPLPNLYAMLKSWGVTPTNDVVVDPSAGRHYTTDPTVLVPVYQSSKITDPLNLANEAAVVPASLSLAVSKNAEFQATPILQTDAAGYGHTDLQSQSTAYDASKDIKGPLTIGVMLQSAAAAGGATSSATAAPATAGFRGVVFGSATFAQNQIVDITQGNQDLFLNAVGWLTGRSQGIEIRPTTQANNQVFLSGAATRGLFYGFVIILPLASLLVGGAIWNTRRGL
jgi:ABC-type uncharacterized transport system involved in gliding motility auxiliary subunit